MQKKNVLKLIITVALSFSALASTSAYAWFFLFLPIPKAHANTASTPGDSCVKSTAKEGDTLTAPTGNIAKITKIYGSSPMCATAALPLLATVDYTSSVTFTPEAGIDLPDNFKTIGLSDRERFYQGIVLTAKTDDGRLFIKISATKRSVISDVRAFAAAFKQGNCTGFADCKMSDTEELEINGMRAWRWQFTTRRESYSAQSYTHLMTFVEGSDEIVGIEAICPDGEYASLEGTFRTIASSVRGLGGPDVRNSGKTPTPVSATARVIPTALPIGGPMQESPELRVARSTVADNPERAEPWCQLGDVYFRENNYSKSAASFERAVKLDPSSSDALFGLGRTYNALGQADKVTQIYTKLKTVDAIRAAAYYRDYLLP